MTFKAFSTLVDNPQAGTVKKVSSIRVGIRLYNTSGNLSITDLVLQEGPNGTGYAPDTAEMLVNTTNLRRVNAVVHGEDTLVLMNAGTAACGLNVHMTALDDCSTVSLSQCYGAQRLTVGALAAGDVLTIDSGDYTVSRNGVAVEKSGFFPYAQDGISRHNIQTAGAIRLLFDFQERNGGAST